MSTINDRCGSQPPKPVLLPKSATPCPRNSCQGGYGPCLDVKFTNACNGHCSFCIEEGGYCPAEAPLNVLIGHAIADPSPTVLVLGGEPTINMDRLVKFLEGIRPYKEHIYLTTNGCFLSKGNAILLRNLLDGINISVHHYNRKLANQVLRLPEDAPNQLSFKKLKEAIQVFQTPNKNGHWVPVRINTNLVKGFLDTYDDVYKMILRAVDWGADTIRFTELQNVDDTLFADATKIFPELKDIDPWSQGCEQELHTFAPIKVVVKIGCGHVVASRPTPPCIGKSSCHVMYPNGEITKGWVSKKPAAATETPAQKQTPKKATAAKVSTKRKISKTPVEQELDGFACHQILRSGLAFRTDEYADGFDSDFSCHAGHTDYGCH